jgi:putative spermidine/putrescine transport system substrate-binding protein
MGRVRLRAGKGRAIMTLLKTLYEKDLYPELDELGETSYARDCLTLAAERLGRGEISRRDFLIGATALGALPGLAPQALAQPLAPPLAQQLALGGAREIVIVNWGGDSIPAYAKAFGEPFEKATGVKVALDGTGPLPAKIRAMVQSGKVVWDLIDFDASKAIVLDAEGLLQPIDYSIVDKNKVYPGWAYRAGVAFYIYSSVLTYDSSKLTEKPTSWIDFWDVEKFPGQRALRKTPEGGIEACMMAAGRAPKDVYPIDIDLAVAKVKELKSNLITWNTGSQSQDLLRNGEVVMAQLWHSRSATLFKESKGKYQWTWNQGLMNVDVWSVPKDNPAGVEAAMKLIAFTQDPQRQVDLLRILGNGPVNPAAAAMVPDDIKMFDPTQPEHRAVQAVLNPDWWNEPSGRGGLSNDALVREKWLDAVSL